jgi:hypothetical protein
MIIANRLMQLIPAFENEQLVFTYEVQLGDSATKAPSSAYNSTLTTELSSLTPLAR